MSWLFAFKDKFPFQDISIIKGLLTVGDVLYCAVAAFFITWIILRVSKIFRFFTVSLKMVDYEAGDINRIIQKCCQLFPNETVLFHGKKFTRGMIVKVTTRAEKTFEGKLIGLNNENIICVLTKNHIAADILDNIADIVAVENEISET